MNDSLGANYLTDGDECLLLLHPNVCLAVSEFYPLQGAISYPHRSKIVSAACRIAAGSTEKLRLGNTSVCRDWGWAPEYVEAMWLMLQQEQAEDYIVATGATYALQDLVQEVFAGLDLDWQEHVELNPDLLRPTDIMISVANPGKVERLLGWKARFSMPDVVGMMVAEKKQHILAQ